MSDKYPKRIVEAANALGYGADNEPVMEQLMVFAEALRIYEERNKKYRDNWVRMGWRGMLIRIRERSERLWDEFWSKEDYAAERERDRIAGRDDVEDDDDVEVDDALDLINFSAFFVRAVRSGNRDGTWFGGIR